MKTKWDACRGLEVTNERQDPNEVSKMFFMTCELYIQHCYNIISTKGKTSDAVKPAYSNFRVMGLLYIIQKDIYYEI